MTQLTRFRVNSPKVIHQNIDGEVIIINLESGNYYSLSKSGPQIWNALQVVSSQSDIVESLGVRYDGAREDFEQHVTRLLGELQAEGLIVALDGTPAADAHSSSPVGETPPARSTFEPPVLEKYEDMQDLILIDPVHDVEEEGWPHARG